MVNKITEFLDISPLNSGFRCAHVDVSQFGTKDENSSLLTWKQQASPAFVPSGRHS